MPTKIRVLVVDDSAFIRKILTRMLGQSPLLEVVGTARDGEDALEQVALHKPDVLTLDLVMPRMNGVEFLLEQAKRGSVPVVICSIAHESGEMALDAFEAGAVDFVQKPTALATDRIYEIAEELIAKVVGAAGTRALPLHVPVAPAKREFLVPPSTRESIRAQVVVLGISTGGPQALRELIPRFPADFPVPIAVVLHMPVGYTEMYAERLNGISALHVVEAHEGDVLGPGMMWLAPAGRHLTFVRGGDGVIRAHLDQKPLGTQHRPAVDVLFRSAADVFGERVLGVVMTGMGNDGLLGAGHIKANGGRIVTEAEDSCVVYGMPRVVAEAMLSDRVAHLNEMATAIMEMI